ncbi:hypothetical protein KGM_201561 [Danaus plexippus plexippus]|uniref:Uncharacterized protein n=1 Tax=Danaus plexippus plexippus TaxID=278856 RepID=A0A212EJ18_DANPL|nr:hypothetical protein KGM_201561 [Danaus plexippus plexippus]
MGALFARRRRTIKLLEYNSRAQVVARDQVIIIQGSAKINKPRLSKKPPPAGDRCDTRPFQTMDTKY